MHVAFGASALKRGPLRLLNSPGITILLRYLFHPSLEKETFKSNFFAILAIFLEETQFKLDQVPCES